MTDMNAVENTLEASPTFNSLAGISTGTPGLTGAMSAATARTVLSTAGVIPAVPLTYANGGFGTSLTAGMGNIYIAGSSNASQLAAASAANKILLSGGAGNPTWSTPTYPAVAGSAVAGQMLKSDGTNWVFSNLKWPLSLTSPGYFYASATDTISVLTGTSALFTTDASGAPVPLTIGVGQMLLGVTGGTPVAGTITAGTGISVSATSGAILLGVVNAGVAVATITGSSQTLAINTSYTANGASLITFALPAVSPVGSVIEIVGAGAGMWAISQAAGQSVYNGATSTTVGVSGSITATTQYSSLIMKCVVADTTWSVVGRSGTFTIV